MLLIVLSDNKFSLSEPKVVTELFANGLSVFHLRKPKASKNSIIKYLKLIPEEYHDRIVIHSHHNLALKYNLKGIHLTRKHKKKKFITWLKLKYLTWKKPELFITTSFHHISDLKENNFNFNYVFLSPVFDSVSKKGYLSSFTEIQLISSLEKTKYKVIALGGVDDEKLKKVQQLGFSGAAMVGYIWESDSPLESFIRIKQIDQDGGASFNTKIGIVRPSKINF